MPSPSIYAISKGKDIKLTGALAAGGWTEDIVDAIIAHPQLAADMLALVLQRTQPRVPNFVSREVAASWRHAQHNDGKLVVDVDVVAVAVFLPNSNRELVS